MYDQRVAVGGFLPSFFGYLVFISWGVLFVCLFACLFLFCFFTVSCDGVWKLLEGTRLVEPRGQRKASGRLGTGEFFFSVWVMGTWLTSEEL